MVEIMLKCRLAEILEERKMPQYKLAEETGIAASTISRLYNNNSTRLDLKVINKLMEYLELEEVGQLFKYEK